jgi:hypothetical protein
MPWSFPSRRPGHPFTPVIESLTNWIACMLSRVRNPRGRPINAPAAFIQPCRRQHAELMSALQKQGRIKAALFDD